MIINCSCRTGFEEERIEAILHMIELSQKHQTTSFGLGIASVSVCKYLHSLIRNIRQCRYKMLLNSGLVPLRKGLDL